MKRVAVIAVLCVTFFGTCFVLCGKCHKEEARESAERATINRNLDESLESMNKRLGEMPKIGE